MPVGDVFAHCYADRAHAARLAADGQYREFKALAAALCPAGGVSVAQAAASAVFAEAPEAWKEGTSWRFVRGGGGGGARFARATHTHSLTPAPPPRAGKIWARCARAARLRTARGGVRCLGAAAAR